MIKIRSAFQILCCIIIASSFLGCSTVVPTRTDPGLVGYQQFGQASYYAMKYQYRKTASGERLNQFALTAAHKKLPFGTRVLVTNIKNGKSVEVKINDRGPFVRGRIIDLTRAAFSKIADLSLGVIDVKIEITR